MPSGFQCQEGVIANNVHTQVQSGICHQYANGTQTDDADGFSRDFGTDELLFASFYGFFHVFIACQSLYPLSAVDDAAGGYQETCQHQFFYGVGIGTGGIEYGNPHFCAFVNGNVVGACTCAGYPQQVVVELHAVHVEAAQNDALRACSFRVYVKFCFRQFAQTCLRNLVQCFDGIHTDILLYLFSASNCFINATSASTPSLGIAL